MTVQLYFSRRHRRWAWVRVVASTRIEPGHGWSYRGLVRRDTISLGGVGVIVLRLTRVHIRAAEGAR